MSFAQPTRRKIVFAALGLTITIIGWNLLSRAQNPSVLKDVVSVQEPESVVSVQEPAAVKDWKYDGGKLLGEHPQWKSIREYEGNLPQHNLDLPFPEGRTGRFVKFSNQQSEGGWNNVFNDVLLCTHLAYLSKRAYVFQDYVWAPHHFPYRIPYVGESEADIPRPHTPLNAIISGPSAGGPWHDDAPRSVSSAFFDIVCPKEERFLIYTDEAKQPVRDSTGSQVLEHWVKLLEPAEHRCIEVIPGPSGKDGEPQVFDLWLLGSGRLNDMWESFGLTSPTVRLLRSSTVVISAVERNQLLFISRGPRGAGGYVPKDGHDHTLAMHVRRGDYKGHCYSLAGWHSTYYSWNLLPFLPDPYNPKDLGFNETETLKHCLPNVQQIVQRAKDVRRDYLEHKSSERALDVVYILTNDDTEWLDELKAELKKDGWYSVITTQELQLDPEQTVVSMSVDMEIAQKAAVFVGNGWSSYTSNVVHRRLAEGKEASTTRFW